jgi:hypothetical protein
MAKKNSIVVLDNNGESFDRYTIINRKTGDVWGASENPSHPQGFGSYNHNIADSYWSTAYGSAWRKRINEKMAIKCAVRNYLIDTTNIGARVSLKTLPKEVLTFIDYILTD